MIHTLIEIKKHGGHFIPNYARIIFRNVYILRGEILLYEKLYRATVISVSGQKYLISVGNNYAERRTFFDTLSEIPLSTSKHAVKSKKGNSPLNIITLFLAAYLIAISTKAFEAGMYLPSALCMLLGGITFLICLYVKSKRR